MTALNDVDPISKQRFMWKALAETAEQVGGVTPGDKDGVIVWCTNMGLLVARPTQHGQVILTQAGVNLVWSYANHAARYLELRKKLGRAL